MLFRNKDQHFSLSGSVSPNAFKGDRHSNGRFGLMNQRKGPFSFGLGVAVINVTSDDGNRKDGHKNTIYQMNMPIGYRTKGFDFVMSPRFGYAQNTYSRTGIGSGSYKGFLEKRIFGVMNEARYPLAINGWKIEPAIEMNFMGYSQRGKEDVKNYSLRINSQTNYSLESGVGLYVNRKDNFKNSSSLYSALELGMYHEFLGPDKMNVSMQGMDGSFTIYDEDHSKNHALVRLISKYDYNDFSITNSFATHIDKEVRSILKTRFSWGF